MKKILLVALLMSLFVTTPLKAQFFQSGLKMQYSTLSVDEMISTVQSETKDFSLSTDLLKSSEVGLFFRLNPGKWITVQAEANISIGSVWDSVDAQGEFIKSALYMFQHISDVNFSVPIMAGVRLLDVQDFFTLRVLVGPEFYTSIKSVKEKNIDFSKYSLAFGVGIDLFSVIAVDGRIMRYSDGNMVYKLGVGLIF